MPFVFGLITQVQITQILLFKYDLHTNPYFCGAKIRINQNVHKFVNTFYIFSNNGYRRNNPINDSLVIRIWRMV